MNRLIPAVVLGLGLALVPGALKAAELDQAVYTFFQVEQLEYRAGNDDALAWDVNAWIGNDEHRLVFKSEGERPIGKDAEAVELQFLYRRPVSDFFDLNIGIRHDLRPNPDRTYGVIGLQGLAKQFVETDLDLFVSEEGNVSVRLAAGRDFRLTQRLILEPSLEANLAFSGDREIESGAGLNSLELGLRLRYEIRREFAPYIGLNWEKTFGATANFAEQDGEPTDNLSLVAGVSFWF